MEPAVTFSIGSAHEAFRGTPDGLALGSWAFMLAVFAGGYALAYFLRKEWI